MDGWVWQDCLRGKESSMARIDPELPLETPRLVLEPIVVGHAAALFEVLQAPDLYIYIPQEPPSSLEALTARFEALSSRHSPDGKEDWLNWALRQRATDVYVGTVQATVRADHTALLAYMIFPAFWRQGYAQEACARVIAHLFEDYHVSRVAAELDTRNIASIRLVEALRFARVATTPGADFFKGTVSDEYRYELSSAAFTGKS
jgi:RimJ/RimL family protein N-acetyltransferase